MATICENKWSDVTTASAPPENCITPDKPYTVTKRDFPLNEVIKMTILSENHVGTIFAYIMTAPKQRQTVLASAHAGRGPKGRSAQH